MQGATKQQLNANSMVDQQKQKKKVHYTCSA